MQEYDVRSTLSFSKHSSSTFPQTKRSSKLGHLVDLRRNNQLTEHDCNEHNNPGTTNADPAQHIAGKKGLCMSDCSQIYHCLEMADEQSIQLLPINLGFWTFAYKRSPRDHNRSPWAFNSFVPEHLDAVVKPDRCAQYVADLGIAANTTDEMVQNIELVFHCIEKAGLKLSIDESSFAWEIDLSGNTISSQRKEPIKKRIENYLKLGNFPSQWYPYKAK